LYQDQTPSPIYRYEGVIAGLKIMFEDGVAGKQFYLGDDEKSGDGKSCHLYSLANIAAFIGQSMKETIHYNACDENSWGKSFQLLHSMHFTMYHTKSDLTQLFLRLL